ncbi:hypothetical protein C8J57DRAFT_1496775 [Mycena rebaudengoi]|nr:hypothetical protein C8J57DRAFT_1496775 [Mycena rebaudengoi]
MMMQTRSLYGRRRLSPLSVAPVQFSVAPVIPGRPHIDNAYDTWGLPRILTALEHGHGTEFVDAAQTLSALRKPFSEVQYSVIAPMFGLPPKPSIQFEGFDELTILSTMLPMSVVGKLVTRTIEAFATPWFHP